MINTSKLPPGFVPLTEQQFAKAYREAKESAGDFWSTLDIVRSWTAYQADPAGHFLSKPPYITMTDNDHEQQRQEAGVADR